MLKDFKSSALSLTKPAMKWLGLPIMMAFTLLAGACGILNADGEVNDFDDIGNGQNPVNVDAVDFSIQSSGQVETMFIKGVIPQGCSNGENYIVEANVYYNTSFDASDAVVGGDIDNIDVRAGHPNPNVTGRLKIVANEDNGFYDLGYSSPTGRRSGELNLYFENVRGIVGGVGDNAAAAGQSVEQAFSKQFVATSISDRCSPSF